MAANSGGWRRLPTAWLHLFLVECRHIYLAVMCWYHLLNTVNVKCKLLKHQIGTELVERYYVDLFFFGHAKEALVEFNHNKPLRLREQFITDEGLNVPWIIIAWTLPIGSVVLLAFIVISFVAVGVRDFGSARYLDFTWHLARKPTYQFCVAFMALGPLLLPVVWFLQVVGFTEGKERDVNFAVMRDCTFSGILLLFALNLLAYPTAAVHNWSDEFLSLHFRRSPLSLVLQTNASFGAKLVDALWSAQNGDKHRLERYVDEPGRVEEVLKICRRAQEKESIGFQSSESELARLSPLGQTSGSESGSADT